MRFKKLKKTIVVLGVSSFILNSSIPVYATHQVVVSNGVVKIKDVPVIKQFPELPTGCEATALTMLLKYYGVNVTKQDVANKLPRVALPYYKNNIRYGGDPNKGFVGNPYSGSSYGVFEKPILEIINKYLPNRAEDLTGKTLSQLLEYVKNGKPVMIWATINMQNIIYRQSWNLETGTLFRWPGREHAVVITGYDTNYIYLNDPYTGSERKYKREVVENRYNALGKRAVAIKEAFKQIPFKIVSDGIIKYESSNQKAIQKEDKILIPVSCLSNIDSLITSSYKDNKIYLNIQDEELELDKKCNEVEITFKNKKNRVYYEIKDGVTQINLKDLETILPITYCIEDNELIIKVNKVVDMMVDNKQLMIEDGREIIMRDDKIWMPIIYINQFVESFTYEYKDKKIYLYIDEHAYELENSAGDIDLVLDDDNQVKLYYEVEKGVTRIDFKGLAQYLQLEYTNQDATIFINKAVSEDEIIEE